MLPKNWQSHISATKIFSCPKPASHHVASAAATAHSLGLSTLISRVCGKLRGHMHHSDSSSLLLLTLLPGVARISAATGCRHRSSTLLIGVWVSVPVSACVSENMTLPGNNEPCVYMLHTCTWTGNQAPLRKGGETMGQLCCFYAIMFTLWWERAA